MQRLLVFASGTKEGGGSGFRNLVERSRGDKPDLRAEIVGVVSNHPNGGVRQHAERLGIPFTHFSGPYDEANYRQLVACHEADWVALSGWLKLVIGLDPTRTFNIHPGPLPEFGGPGMYGHHVHEAVMDAYRRGELTESAVTMHFVAEEYDRGPTIFRVGVSINKTDTAESLATRVNMLEHHWQPLVTDYIVNGRISWDGRGEVRACVPLKLAKYFP